MHSGCLIILVQTKLLQHVLIEQLVWGILFTTLLKVAVAGIGPNQDGTYRMTDNWANGRGVFKLEHNPNYSVIEKMGSSGRSLLAQLLGESMEADEWCVSWHGEYRHWWITSCHAVGTNYGWAWLEEDVRCPYKGTKWRRGGSDKVINTTLVTQTVFARSLQSGIEQLTQVATLLVDKPAFGVLTDIDYENVKDGLVSAAKYIKTGHKILLVDINVLNKHVNQTLIDRKNSENRLEDAIEKIKKNIQSLKSLNKTGLIYNDQLNKGRNSERDLKRLFDEASRKWESKKRYENEVWSEACAVDSVWTWLSLGITCTLTIGSASDVISAEEIKRSREQTYSKKKDLVRQYESKVNEINVEIKKFEASLRSEKANLEHFKNDIRRLKTKQINLSTLNHDFKSNAQELSKLVTSVQR